MAAPAAEYFEAALQARQASGEWAVERCDASCVPRLSEGNERAGADLELWRVTSAAKPTLAQPASEVQS